MWQNDDLAFNMGSEMVGLCRIPEGVTVTLFGYVKLHPKTLLKLFFIWCRQVHHLMLQKTVLSLVAMGIITRRPLSNPTEKM